MLVLVWITGVQVPPLLFPPYSVSASGFIFAVAQKGTRGSPTQMVSNLGYTLIHGTNKWILSQEVNVLFISYFELYFFYGCSQYAIYITVKLLFTLFYSAFPMTMQKPCADEFVGCKFTLWLLHTKLLTADRPHLKTAALLCID